jgi:hypothetical protein
VFASSWAKMICLSASFSIPLAIVLRFKEFFIIHKSVLVCLIVSLFCSVKRELFAILFSVFVNSFSTSSLVSSCFASSENNSKLFSDIASFKIFSGSCSLIQRLL